MTSRTLVIAWREFRTRVLTWTFWAATLGFPLLSIGFMVVVTLAGQGSPLKLGIHASGATELVEPLMERLEGDQFEPRALNGTLEQALAAVENEEVEAVLVLDASTARSGEALYRAHKPMRLTRRVALAASVRRVVTNALLESNGIDTEALSNADVRYDSLDPDGAEDQDVAVSQSVELVVGSFGIFLIYMVTGIYPLMMLQAVSEEQQTGLVEVLLATASPREILFGKLFGLAGMAAVQVGTWSSPMLIPLLTTSVELPEGFDDVPAQLLGRIDDLLLGVVCALLAFTLYSLLAALLGVFCASKQQAEQAQMVVLFPPMIAAVGAFNALFAPDTGAARVFAYLPIVSPSVLYARYVAGVAWWQTGLSLVLLVVAVSIVIRLVVRLYPLAALGLWRPSLKRLWP